MEGNRKMENKEGNGKYKFLVVLYPLVVDEAECIPIKADSLEEAHHKAYAMTINAPFETGSYDLYVHGDHVPEKTRLLTFEEAYAL